VPQPVRKRMKAVKKTKVFFWAREQVWVSSVKLETREVGCKGKGEHKVELRVPRRIGEGIKKRKKMVEQR